MLGPIDTNNNPKRGNPKHSTGIFKNRKIDYDPTKASKSAKYSSIPKDARALLNRGAEFLRVNKGLHCIDKPDLEFNSPKHRRPFKTFTHALKTVDAHLFPLETVHNISKSMDLTPVEFLQLYALQLIRSDDINGALKALQILSQHYNISTKDIHFLIGIFQSIVQFNNPESQLLKALIEALLINYSTQNSEISNNLNPEIVSKFEQILEPHLFNLEQNPDTSLTQQMLDLLGKINRAAANQLLLKSALFHLQQSNTKDIHQVLAFLMKNYVPTSKEALNNDLNQIIRALLINDKQPPLLLMEAAGYLKKILEKAKDFQDELEKGEKNAGLRWILIHIIRAVDQWCQQTEKRKLHDLQQIVAGLVYFSRQGEPAAQHRLGKLVEWLLNSLVLAEQKYGKELAKESSSNTFTDKKK